MAPIILFLFLSGCLVLCYAHFIEHRAYWIRREKAVIRKKLNPPLRILHLSDIHFAAEDKRLSEFFDQLAKKTYDFISITGDIFDCEAGIPMAVRNLKKLKAENGIFAVLGNHDYYDYSFSNCSLYFR